MIMSIEENLQVGLSDGGPCLICKKLIPGRQVVLKLEIEVNALVMIPVRKQAHIKCAQSVEGLLHRRIDEARRKAGI